MKKILLAGVVSVAFVGPVWAGCDPPGGGVGHCPSPTPTPVPTQTQTQGQAQQAIAGAASHATAGASASVSNVNRSELSNSNTNRVTIRNVINTPASTGSIPPLTVAAPIAPAAAAPVAPRTPAATTPTDPPADPATHTHSGRGGGSGGGGYAGGVSIDARQAPEVLVPSIGGGGADCPVVGFGVGGSGLGGGGGFGPSWISPDCNARKVAELLANLGHRDAALAVLADHFPEVRKAMTPAATPVGTQVVAAPRPNAPTWCASKMAANPDITYAQCE